MTPRRVGRIGRPHGVRGEVTVVPDGDDPGRFSPGAELLTDRGDTLVVVASRPYRDKGLVVGFTGVDDRNAAEALRGTLLYTTVEDRRPLDEGEFWSEELVGLTAVSPDGTVLGEVVAVEHGAGQDRLVVATTGGRQVLVPFVKALVGEPADGRIEVRDPGGLF